MLDGWRAQMLARGLAIDTIKARCRLIARFVEFTNGLLHRAEAPNRWDSKVARPRDDRASPVWRQHCAGNSSQ